MTAPQPKAGAWTRGPWTAREPSASTLTIRVDCPAGEAIANVWGGDEEAKSNAHLIAAATEMAEALAFYADPTNWVANGHPQIDADTVPFIRDRGAIARAALARARGDQ